MLAIPILAVNEAGQEFGNAGMSAGRDLPLLQDVDSNSNGQSDVWVEWDVAWRDVVVLDAKNQKSAVYNLTDNNLAEPANYQELRNLLVQTAVRNQRPWSNPVIHADVNNDGRLTNGDAHWLINELNQNGSRALPPLEDGQQPPAYYDTNLDNHLAPIDALIVINAINAASSAPAGEGEESGAAASAPLAPPDWLLPPLEDSLPLRTAHLGAAPAPVPLRTADSSLEPLVRAASEPDRAEAVVALRSMLSAELAKRPVQLAPAPVDALFALPF